MPNIARIPRLMTRRSSRLLRLNLFLVDTAAMLKLVPVPVHSVPDASAIETDQVPEAQTWYESPRQTISPSVVQAPVCAVEEELLDEEEEEPESAVAVGVATAVTDGSSDVAAAGSAVTVGAEAPEVAKTPPAAAAESAVEEAGSAVVVAAALPPEPLPPLTPTVHTPAVVARSAPLGLAPLPYSTTSPGAG